MNHETSSDDPADIILNGVCFSYGENVVLSDLCLSIPRGEVWALVGRSGSGKSTLIHVVSGLFRPQKGHVSVNGRGDEPGRIRGIVFQEECLLGWLSARDNVLFPRHMNGSADAAKVASDLLQRVGLADNELTYPHEMSVGMRKRLEFARALAADTRYILADEPFGTIDALTRRDLWRLWLELRQAAPRTGIFSTHDPEEAIRLCDAVVLVGREAGGGAKLLFKVDPTIRQLAVDEPSNQLELLSREVIGALGISNGDKR